ncbi:hypothetical protein L1987_83925 [Smallanthus sonchifolius]|uniref:Uncharacterized protein n=1 Tax=Smallanthus sonchifolius TaxID=185202 RepID=A0ACB8YDZ6_9ASTR|nr:hypothetical protein L1987_83925 [Smallanthus sonchifolius]
MLSVTMLVMPSFIPDSDNLKLCLFRNLWTCGAFFFISPFLLYTAGREIELIDPPNPLQKSRTQKDLLLHIRGFLQGG